MWQLNIVTWETFIFAVVYRNCEIAFVDVLLKKYKVKAVSITCNGNRIPFIERVPVRFGLDALSIFKLWCCTIIWLHFLLPHL